MNPYYKITKNEIEREIMDYVRQNGNEYDIKMDESKPVIKETILDDFYELQPNIKIAYLKCYQMKRIYGMDMASGICVRILDPQPNDHILDLCCAPGMKLLYISQLMSEDTRNIQLNNNKALYLINKLINVFDISHIGSVTGVDISPSRLNVCKKLIRNERCNNVRIYQHDGKTFDTMVDDTFVYHNKINNTIHGSLFNKKMKKKYSKRNTLNNPISSKCLYDKILIDSQCSHDGSIKHILKYKHQFGWNKFMENVLNEDNVNNIIQLQKELILNGFRLLKDNGIMIYSTCSLTYSQNEMIVLHLLKKHDNCTLLDINDTILNDMKHEKGILRNIQHKNTRYDTSKCIRFHPILSQTSGLFIAKITKQCRSGCAI